MPDELRQFLAGLAPEIADKIDIWLDSDPGAIEKMRKITYPLTVEGREVAGLTPEQHEDWVERAYGKPEWTTKDILKQEG